MSTQEGSNEVQGVGFSYADQDDMHDFPFLHNDARLQDDKVSFNIIAVGDVGLSPSLPRVNWRSDAVGSQWIDPLNWGGYAYPGQGIAQSEIDNGTYDDVSVVALGSDSVYCKYTIINPSVTSPIVSSVPPQVQVLVDRDSTFGTYYVNDTSDSELTVLQRVIGTIPSERVENEGNTVILIEEGALEIE